MTMSILPFSLSPSCVTRQKTARKKMTSRNPVCSYFVLSTRFTLDGLSEKRNNWLSKVSSNSVTNNFYIMVFEDLLE